MHWHGIELESYYDGVAGFGGSARRVTPVIAPRDSFYARFTPPRAGTFIHHSHVDEPRQHRAGLAWALIGVDPARSGTSDARVFLIKSARQLPAGPTTMEINGQSDPDTVRLRVEQRYRLRVLSVALVTPSTMLSVTQRPDSSGASVSNSMLVQWRLLAKDGADLPEGARVARTARQVLSMGETYGFEFTPRAAGMLRLEMRSPAPVGRLLVRAPIRVE